jgi:hypothetical protein
MKKTLLLLAFLAVFALNLSGTVTTVTVNIGGYPLTETVNTDGNITWTINGQSMSMPYAQYMSDVSGYTIKVATWASSIMSQTTQGGAASFTATTNRQFIGAASRMSGTALFYDADLRAAADGSEGADDSAKVDPIKTKVASVEASYTSSSDGSTTLGSLATLPLGGRTRVLDEDRGGGVAIHSDSLLIGYQALKDSDGDSIGKLFNAGISATSMTVGNSQKRSSFYFAFVGGLCMDTESDPYAFTYNLNTSFRNGFQLGGNVLLTSMWGIANDFSLYKGSYNGEDDWFNGSGNIGLAVPLGLDLSVLVGRDLVINGGANSIFSIGSLSGTGSTTTVTSDMRFGTVNAELNATYRLRALPNLKFRGGLRMTAVLASGDTKASTQWEPNISISY